MKIAIDQKLNKNTVLSMMQCYSDSPCYMDYSKAYDEIVNEDMNELSIEGYFIEKEPSEVVMDTDTVYQKLIYCICTLGPELDARVNQYFAENDFVKGMIINTIGDFLLFEASRKLYNHVRKIYKAKGLHMTSRFEPGMQDVPVEEQEHILSAIHSEHDTSISLSSGFMYAPQKTLGYYYGASTELPANIVDHDCRKCNSETCHYRKVIIHVKQGDLETCIQCHKGTNLLEALRKENVAVPAYCNGAKACGKCKVKVTQHSELVRTEEEKALLTKEELEDGVVLACFHHVIHDLHVQVPESKKTGNIMADYKLHNEGDKKYQALSIEGLEENIDDQYSITQLINHKFGRTFSYKKSALRQLSTIENLNETLYAVVENGNKFLAVSEKEIPAYGIAIDIGTTTVVISLINLLEGKELDSYKISNPQGAYGADVISRINHDMSDQDHIQGKLIREAIEGGISNMVSKNALDARDLHQVTISGNTTMLYLLLGMNPYKLSIAPFTTVDLNLNVYNWEEVFGTFTYTCEVTLLPCISAYIGADISSGFYYSDLDKQQGNILFIDIGTNGEMALKVEDKIICASTAAGPALEGANIKCGMSSVKGAINHIRLLEESFDYDVIGDTTPVGICGSALVDVIGELITAGYIEPTGRLKEASYDIYKDESHHVAIYQEDIRQFQLAKAAIAAGVEVMIKHADLTYEDIDALYLAGGFGNHLDIHQAVVSGLIHPSLESKVQLIGNSALGGCAKYMMEEGSRERFKMIQDKCDYVELSMDLSFNNAYMDNMMF